MENYQNHVNFFSLEDFNIGKNIKPLVRQYNDICQAPIVGITRMHIYELVSRIQSFGSMQIFLMQIKYQVTIKA